MLINNQRDQILQKIKDSKDELISIRESVKLVQDEKQIIEPMVKKGYEPKLRLVPDLAKAPEDSKAAETGLNNQVSLYML